MTEKVDIFMPIIWADYEKKTSKLSMLEHGAYMLLLKEYWNNGGAIECECDANALPTHMRFYRSSRAMTTEEQAAIDYILAKFFTYSDGYYHQARADEELEKAREKRRKAKASADKRWNKAEENEPMRSDMRSDMLKPCSTPTPILTTYKDADLQIFDEILQFTGGKILDPSPITKWLNAGASKELIMQVIKARFHQGVKSLKFFDGMIADAIEYEKQPLTNKGKRNGKQSITSQAENILRNI